MVRKAKMTPNNDGFGSVHTVRIPLWPYLVAPLSCLAAFPGTWLVHRSFGRGVDAGWTGFALGLAGIGLILFVAVASRPRGVVMQWMATGNAVLAFLWLVPAILEGPTSKALFGLWLLGTFVVSVACAVYRIMRQARGDTGENGRVLNGEFGELGDAVKQLRDVAFSRPKIGGAKVSTALSVPPGRTFAEVAAAKAEIASALDVKATAIRTVEDPDSERRGTMTVVPVDQLRHPIPDPGPSAPGGSIAEPIVLGLDEEGDPVEVILPGDPKRHRNAVGMWAVVGTSGAGKTELLLRVLKEAVTRYDVDVIVADARKAGQLPAWLKRAAKRWVPGRDNVEGLLEGLAERVAARSEQLGQRGFKEWQEGCGLQFEFYVIFEAAAVVSRNSAIVDLAESVRSVGICLLLELQRATYDRLPTSARSNINTWTVLGVQKEDDAEAALSDETVAAGAAPWKWKNGKPGYFYQEWAGRDKALWASPCRAFIETDEKREADVAQALGWDDEPVDDEPTGETPAPLGGPESDPADEPADEPGTPPGVDPNDPPDDVDPSKPIVVPAGMPRIPFGDGRKMPSGEALGLLRSYIEDQANARVEYLRPQDMGDVLAQTGLSGSWLYGAMNKLTRGEDPLLAKPERGVYRILTSELV